MGPLPVSTVRTADGRLSPETLAGRSETGRVARAQAPRSAHAELPARSRPDPVETLAVQDAGRVVDLLPIRYGRMALSPFTFFRGAALIMADDLAGTPVSGLEVQLCGDAHLANFGFFASPERRLVFDINDFDETLRGPFEWDVKRLAASFDIAAREAEIPAAERRSVVETVVRSYRTAMHRFAGMTNLAVWYVVADVSTISRRYHDRLAKIPRRRGARSVAKARTRDQLGSMRRFAEVVDGRPRIAAAPPLVVPVRDLFPDVAERGDLEQSMQSVLEGYRESLQADRRLLYDRYRVADIAHKVVGVGSVGTRCWMVLLLGRDVDDPWFLQVKQAGPAVLEAALGRTAPVGSGERVVDGQRLMQTVGDLFLGWQRATGRDGVEREFYVRQLRDWKGSVDVDDPTPAGLRAYAELCGWTLARAHARSGDPVAIAGYLGTGPVFDRAVARFADAYSALTVADHAALRAAIVDGRVRATPGV